MENWHWIGDGICDDFINNSECLYDGGDCCSYEINDDYCSICACIGSPFNNSTTKCQDVWTENRCMKKKRKDKCHQQSSKKNCKKTCYNCII